MAHGARSQSLAGHAGRLVDRRGHHVAELGDLGRFDHPSKLMANLGLIPSEHSSGESIKRGPITKAGNGHVRRVLVEAAHAYRLPERVSRILLKRQEGLGKK